MSVVGPRKARPASQIFASSPAPHTDDLPAGKKRPQTQIFTSAQFSGLSTTEDPFTAPRVPIARAQSVSHRGGVGPSHRRTHSEKSIESPAPGSAAAVVNQMYRGPSGGSGHPLSPISPGSTPRTSYFTPSGLVGSSANLNRPATGSRAVSGSRTTPTRPESGDSSILSRDSAELPSPPRTSTGNTQYTGAVMTQSKLRPLRLVQENRVGDDAAARKNSLPDEEAARKRANRGSWMGWFNRGKDGEAPTPTRANAPDTFPGMAEE